MIGISGIINNALFKWQSWQFAFLSGMILVGFFQPKLHMDQNLFQVLSSGLFVGLGVTLGNGCTSGHGLCGMARLSRRSIAAVFTFMITAMITRFIMNDFTIKNVVEYENSVQITKINIILLIFAGIGAFFGFLSCKKSSIAVVSLFIGMVFGLGLSIGGMTNAQKVKGFLDLFLVLRDNRLLKMFDPSLALVFASGLLPNLMLHVYITNSLEKPLSGCDWNFPRKKSIDMKLIGGASLFGLGT